MTSAGKPLEATIHEQVRIDEEPGIETLVRRARGGDLDAFKAIYDLYQLRLYRYAFARLGRKEEAEDIVQEVFLAMWQKLPSFEVRHPDAFPAWVFRVAHNVTTDRVRRAARTPEAAIKAVPTEPARDEEVLDRREVLSCLQRVPDRQREVLALRFLLDLSQRETARVMGIGESAVESLQVRGLRKLREEMS